MSNDKLNQLLVQLPSNCQGFLNYLKVENKSRNTIINYALDLKKWIKYQFQSSENINASDFESLGLEDLYAFIGSLTGDNSPATIARIVGCIKSFYKYLNKFNHVSKNPSYELTSPKITQRIPKYLVEDDMIKLLQSINSGRCDSPERDYAILLTFLSTGIRLSELLNIQIKDINDNNLTVIGKGDKQREIPLSKSCIDAINDYLNVRESNDSTLFVNQKGNRFTSDGMQKLVKKYLNKIGKTDFSTHKLRHSALSNMLNSGTDLRTLQEIAGHASLTTTEIYTHINNESKRKAVNNTRLAKLKKQKC